MDIFTLDELEVVGKDLISDAQVDEEESGFIDKEEMVQEVMKEIGYGFREDASSYVKSRVWMDYIHKGGSMEEKDWDIAFKSMVHVVPEVVGLRRSRKIKGKALSRVLDRNNIKI